MKKITFSLSLVALFGLSACGDNLTDDEKTQNFLRHTMQKEQIVVPRDKAHQKSDRDLINQQNTIRQGVSSSEVSPQPQVKKN